MSSRVPNNLVKIKTIPFKAKEMHRESLVSHAYIRRAQRSISPLFSRPVFSFCLLPLNLASLKFHTVPNHLQRDSTPEDGARVVHDEKIEFFFIIKQGKYDYVKSYRIKIKSIKIKH